jgi:hypothetical protein
MRQVLKAVLVIGLTILSGSAALAAGYDIKPVGPQDGTIWQNVGTDNLAGAYGLWGFVNGNYYTNAGIHTLPSILASDVASAQLIIPANHGDFFGTGIGPHILQNGPGGGSLNWNVEHFDAIDDGTLTGGVTGDWTRPSLGQLGLYAGGPTWPGQDNTRLVTLDVTNAVKGDLLAGLGSFAWRIIPDAPATAGWNDNATLFFPLSEAVGYGYPNFGAQLVITTVPEPTAVLLLLYGASVVVVRRRASCR